MNDLAILRMADALARHAAGRHELAAKNIANADTPGYRARDLAPFEASLRDRDRIRTTRDRHLTTSRAVEFRAQESAERGAESPNGNTVALPEQVANATNARGAYDRAMAVYSKTMDILRAGLGRR